MIRKLHKLAGGGSQHCSNGWSDQFYAAVFLLAVVLLNGCSTPSFPEVKTAGPEMIQLDQARDTFASSDETVEVTLDPVYQSRKHYRGITFSRFLKRNGHEPTTMSPDTFVQFICKDGYNPVAPLAVLVRDGAFLATGDLDAPSDQNWLQFKYGTSQRDPGMFYLVWSHTTATSDGHPWPYGITGLRIGGVDALLGPALPKAERFQQGFTLFRENCMMCHSVNGVGGTIGIDLNVPRNVFEYWQDDKIPAMVANPAAFRRNAKMPRFDQLGSQAIADILAYVKYMKGHKIQPIP